MKALFLRVRSFFNIVNSSIAFYPTFFAILAVGLGVLMRWIESIGASAFIQERLPVFVINDTDTARNILTTLIAGGISMLVFSFSMVMLLLSQAASNYTPRVLPSLISNRRHQYILGIFLGMIFYNIIALIGIEAHGDEYQTPGFSTLIGIILAGISLGAFIYFIHSISISIQINTILRKLYHDSHNRLTQLIESNYQKDFPNTDNWTVYKAQEHQTLQNISISGLLNLAQAHNAQFDILVAKGSFILKDTPLIKCSKNLEEEQVKDVFKNFNFSDSELVSDNYLLGFKQITEIGIKAMSPGINDPGTALDTLDHITALFSTRMCKTDDSIVLNDEDKPTINLKTVSFKELIYQVLLPFRQYCKHDVTVMQKIMFMLKNLLHTDAVNEEYYEIIKEQAQLCIADAQENIKNEYDVALLRNIYDSLQELR